MLLMKMDEQRNMGGEKGVRKSKHSLKADTISTPL